MKRHSQPAGGSRAATQELIPSSHRGKGKRNSSVRRYRQKSSAYDVAHLPEYPRKEDKLSNGHAHLDKSAALDPEAIAEQLQADLAKLQLIEQLHQALQARILAREVIHLRQFIARAHQPSETTAAFPYCKTYRTCKAQDQHHDYSESESEFDRAQS
jgi:hypothetical protein